MRAWWDRGWCVALAYLAAAVATTWPLTAQLTWAVPADLGDSLLNCWILSWGAQHVLRFAGGDLAAFHGYWQAPIFHPAPLALAYSEHLFAQAVQIAPVYAATGNILLCYNLLFLSTFVLSGLGMYLLARELSGSGLAALASGTFYAFALYRLPQYTHLQVLSSQWLPLALYGLRRFFTQRRWRPLAGATLAVMAQNLSCGYYVLFFAPFVALYCLAEIAARRLWRDWRTLAGLAMAGAIVVLATAPFLVPYLVLRAEGFGPRGIGEVVSFSGDVLSWLTAAPINRVWAALQTFPKPEGELFPGVIAPLLALLAVTNHVRGVWVPGRPLPPWRRASAAVVIVAMSVVVAFTVLVLGTGDANWTLAGVRLRLHEPWKAGLLLAALSATLLAVSPTARRLAKTVPAGPRGGFAVGTLVSAWLALGPVMTIAGHATLLPAPYRLLYSHVPGFDGLRVPARFAMLTACCLAIVAGFGARDLLATSRRGKWLVGIAVALFLTESTAAPLSLNGSLNAPGYQRAPSRMYVGAGAPDVYRFAGSLPASAVLLELPLGTAAWDLQYMFYQPLHRHPIVNGYSGGFPDSYAERIEALAAPEVVPVIASRALASSRATHVIVHRGAYPPGNADSVERWLTAQDATLIYAAGTDRMYALGTR